LQHEKANLVAFFLYPKKLMLFLIILSLILLFQNQHTDQLRHKMRLNLVCVLLVVLQCAADNLLLPPEQVLMSLSIDSSSLEIQREAIRLLTSIQIFGESLKQSPIFICINHEIEDESNVGEIEKSTRLLVEQIYLLDFEKLIISYSKSLPYPTYAPSLNKMCAFDPQSLLDTEGEDGNAADQYMQEAKYLLYLDADIFVAQDPLPLLAQHLPPRRGRDSSVLLW
jgi:hypothetical protein